MGPGTFVDVDDVGPVHAARLHLSGRGVPPAWLSGRQRVLFVNMELCARGTAAANVRNALGEERGENLWGAGQYFAHIFTPSRRNVF